MLRLAIVGLSAAGVVACGGGSSTPASAPTPTPAATPDATTSSIDPFATPTLIVRPPTSTVSVKVGATFAIYLPQDPAAGSWSFSQQPGPVELLSGGSTDEGSTRTQTFNFHAVAAGSEKITFVYTDGHPPSGPNSLTFDIAVT